MLGWGKYWWAVQGSGAPGRRVLCLSVRGGEGDLAAHSWKCLLGTFLVQAPHRTGKGSGQDVLTIDKHTCHLTLPPSGSHIHSITAHPDQSPWVPMDFLLCRDGWVLITPPTEPRHVLHCPALHALIPTPTLHLPPGLCSTQGQLVVLNQQAFW